MIVFLNINPFEGMFKPSSYTKPWLYPILMPYMCLIFVALMIYCWVIQPILHYGKLPMCLFGKHDWGYWFYGSIRKYKCTRCGKFKAE
jgi:hypothetical protein